MRIHLVRYSTSAMFEKKSQIITYYEFIQLMRIKNIVNLAKIPLVRNSH